jgi:DNA-binding GntR family transcriptional regulator
VSVRRSVTGVAPHATLVDRAVDILREQILSGELAADAQLRTAGLADELDMSPIPLREALRVLASEGLVESRPQRGYRVRGVSRRDFEDTCGMMLVLEPLATERAVPHLTDADLEAAQQATADYAAAQVARDWTADARANRRFHFAIYNACGSSWLLHFLNILWGNSQRYERMSSPLRPAQEWAADHARILDACRRREPEAAGRLMHEHVSRAYEVVGRVIDSPEAPAAPGDR